MPIYLQKIPDKNFHPEKDFLVRDSKGCNMTVGLVFLAAFIGIAWYDRFRFQPFSVYHFLYLAIIPAALLMKRAFVNKVIITINKTGFYYFGKLVTNWDNFIDAKLTQDTTQRKYPYDLSDHFVLWIRYGKMGETGFFGRKFLMTAVMDKSEEEIMAAIKFYYDHREPGMMFPYYPNEPEPSSNNQLLSDG